MRKQACSSKMDHHAVIHTQVRRVLDRDCPIPLFYSGGCRPF
uniref:Uncharacterized protein n=1 Tax=Arundo donax TaxID=35708 RepID=A0A0A9EVE3_ARUDO